MFDEERGLQENVTTNVEAHKCLNPLRFLAYNDLQNKKGVLKTNGGIVMAMLPYDVKFTEVKIASICLFLSVILNYNAAWILPFFGLTISIHGRQWLRGLAATAVNLPGQLWMLR